MDAFDWSSVFVEALAFLTVLVTSIYGLYRLNHEKKKSLQAQREMSFQRAALSFPEFIEEWNDIGKDVLNLIENTNLDRFIILRAWNGHLEPRWTTAFYQIREANQEPISYIHFELDGNYVNMLRDISINGSVLIKTEELPDKADLKAIYRAEGVTTSYVVHLGSFVEKDSGSAAVTYCTWATHKEEGFSSDEVTKFKITSARLKGMLESFDEEGKNIKK